MPLCVSHPNQQLAECSGSRTSLQLPRLSLLLTQRVIQPTGIVVGDDHQAVGADHDVVVDDVDTHAHSSVLVCAVSRSSLSLGPPLQHPVYFLSRPRFFARSDACSQKLLTLLATTSIRSSSSRLASPGRCLIRSTTACSSGW